MNTPPVLSTETERKLASLECRLRQTTDLLHVALAVLFTRGALSEADLCGFRVLFADPNRYGGDRGAEHVRWLDGLIGERAA